MNNLEEKILAKNSNNQSTFKQRQSLSLKDLVSREEYEQVTDFTETMVMLCKFVNYLKILENSR